MVTNPRLLPFPIASTTGELADANQVVVADGATLPGVLNGVTQSQAAFERLDATGVGAAIVTFTGDFTAQASNIDTWFDGRQLTRLRCTDNGGISPVTFSLPGATALGTAFDQLVTAGLPEVIRFVIEYTGPNTTFLRVQPRNTDPGTPQIGGTTSIIVRTNVAATIEITRTSGTISDYVFLAIGGIGDTAGGTLDAVKLINPADQTWDASTNGPLPSSGVVKGNAYQVVNAPTDGSGRFSEVMLTGDWVVWEGETFTSWSATPHQWFVIPAHEVRRISALESNFLSTIEVTPQSDRNTITRGANYADSVAEIRIKLYTQQSDYSAADLNTTGDIDEYTDPSDANAYVAIRLPGNFSALEDTLRTLYVYAEDGSGNFSRLLNLHDDFAFQGDFGAESDYLANDTINYNANDTLRIYVGTVVDRYNSQDLDINESNLSDAVQQKLNRVDPNGTDERARLTTLEGKMDALFPLTPDVTDLVGWGDIYNTENDTQAVNITDGYTLIADYRGDATRYESAGVTYSDAGTDVVTYSGLGEDLFRTFGFKVNAVQQVSTVTLTGTSGTANIRLDSVDYLATFNTDLTTTASDFVTTHGTALDTAGITVTSNAAVLTFTAKVGGTAFTLETPTNVTGDLTGTTADTVTEQRLLWIVDGAERIPLIETTTGGNYRINHYTPATTEDQRVVDQFHSITSISGQQTLRAGSTDTATFTATPFPANATQTERTAQLGLDVLLNGVDAEAAHLQDIVLPADLSAEAYQTFDATIPLGPLHSNRSVNVTMRYQTRVSGSDLLVDVQLVTAPSDVTIHLQDVFVALTYTAPVTVARVDNWTVVTDQGGDYQFTGENELIVSFHPFENLGFSNAVPVAVNASGTVDQLNDVDIPIPDNHFDSVEIPDQTAYTGFEFRTFAPGHYLTHSDLAHLLTRRATQWCYGLAELRAVTEHAVTEVVDFTQGIVLVSPNSTRYLLTVDNTGTLKTEVAP